ncbi:hypothetical protein L3Q82_009919, partial [Scortum barcoo]
SEKEAPSPVAMQGETAAMRITENEGKLDVFPQNRTPSSGRASAKSWQYSECKCFNKPPFAL